MKLALGVDAGGTRTRAVLVGPDGDVLARGFAGPGNPVTDPVGAAHSFGVAIEAAAAGHPAGEVGAVGLGVAGVSAFARPAVAALYTDALTALGITAALTPIADVLTAYAAGTGEPSGAVLIAGTGAVAAVVENGAVTRVADGLGWRLGDAGSGVWLGVQAVRATARAWYAGSPSDLTEKLAAAIGIHDADALVTWGNAAPREEFAALAPLVCAACTTDAVARDIIGRAAAELVSTLDELGEFDGPVVLGGGLLSSATPLQSAVRAKLGDRGRPPLIAGDAAVAAARLAVSEGR